MAPAGPSHPWGMSWMTIRNLDYVTYSDPSTRPETDTLITPEHKMAISFAGTDFCEKLSMPLVQVRSISLLTPARASRHHDRAVKTAYSFILLTFALPTDLVI